MRYFDEDKAQRLQAQPWQLDLLKLNPSYVSWGPHEDYMCTEGPGWDSAQMFESWAQSGFKDLDDLNECVNFYFEVSRETEECPHCKGTGLSPALEELNSTFYRMPGGMAGWSRRLTQDDVDMLWAQRRLQMDFPGDAAPTAEAVNTSTRRLLHDAINRHLLLKHRAQIMGADFDCPHCQGNGRQFTARQASVTLVLWILHPRKGASRGVEIKNIQQEDLPSVFAYLRTAAERNAARFSKIPR
jgi:hypothetical protein